jgi:phosphohistidine phosphatase
MRLYLVRHGEAAPMEPDEMRPLTPVGREQARALGKQLAADGVHPAVVLTSPLLRARETGAQIAKATGSAAEADERLAPGATLDDVQAAVAGRGEQVVVVGHQPDCGQIALQLTGEEPRFPAGGMCVIDFDA